MHVVKSTLPVFLSCVTSSQLDSSSSSWSSSECYSHHRLGDVEECPELSELGLGSVHVSAQAVINGMQVAIGDVILACGDAITVEACICTSKAFKL